MKFMFYGCSSLTSLPDISKWSVTNVRNMDGLFSNCLSLSSLPKISKWYLYSFYSDNDVNLCENCISLLKKAFIHRWNYYKENPTDKEIMFGKDYSV